MKRVERIWLVIEEDVESSEKQTLLETCPVCQTKQHGQRHCESGASLELAPICPVCQTEARQGQQYCGHCGASLIESLKPNDKKIYEEGIGMGILRDCKSQIRIMLKAFDSGAKQKTASYSRAGLP